MSPEPSYLASLDKERTSHEFEDGSKNYEIEKSTITFRNPAILPARIGPLRIVTPGSTWLTVWVSAIVMISKSLVRIADDELIKKKKLFNRGKKV